MSRIDHEPAAEFQIIRERRDPDLITRSTVRPNTMGAPITTRHRTNAFCIQRLSVHSACATRKHEVEKPPPLMPTAVQGRELVEILLEVLGASHGGASHHTSFEETPGVLFEADVDLAVGPPLLMNDVLMWPELMHLPVELVVVSVEGLHVVDVLSHNAAHFFATKLVEDLELDVTASRRHTEDVGTAFPAGANA